MVTSEKEAFSDLRKIEVKDTVSAALPTPLPGNTNLSDPTRPWDEIPAGGIPQNRILDETKEPGIRRFGGLLKRR